MVRPHRLDREIEREMAFHVAELTDELMAKGMDHDEACRAARRRFGNYALQKERTRDMDILGWLESTLKDIRLAARGLCKSPGFSVVVVITLGLGIGANTAIFSVLDTVLLRPLPYRNPGELVMLWETNLSKSLNHEPVSPVNFMDYRALGEVFTDAAAWWKPDITLSDESRDPVRVNTIETSNNLFSVLGVQPALGRGFTAGETIFGPEAEAVISDRLWRSRFGGDSSIVGRAVRLDGQTYTILGIMPPGFQFPSDTDVWQKLRWDLKQHSRGAHFMGAIARVRPGVDVTRANTELKALTSRLGFEFKATNGEWSVRAIPLQTEIAGFFGQALVALFVAVGLLLLVACINVANLLLARAASRHREVAIRAALGASTRRLLRQFLAEGIVLASVSSVLGMLLAYFAVRLLIASAPIAIPRADEISINGPALIFTLVIAALTAVAFGLVPGFSVSTGIEPSLKEGGRGFSSSRRATRMRSILVGAEIGLAVVLVAGAGLLIRTVQQLIKEDPGIRANRVWTASIQLPLTSYQEFPKVNRLFSVLLDSARTEPRIASVGLSSFLPLETGSRLPFGIVGRPQPKAGEEAMAQFHSVSEGYFQTLGVPILAGRDFELTDVGTSAGVVVINRVLARQYFPNEDPVGKNILVFFTSIGGGRIAQRMTTDRVHQIVGVVGDVKNQSLRTPAEPAVYFSQRQFTYRSMNIYVRGTGDAAETATILRDIVRKADPALPVFNVRGMDRVIAQPVDQPRFLMFLMSVFAVLTLILASVGIYGLMAYSVTQRRQEISVRMALGASGALVLRFILREGLRLTVAGLIFGIAGAFSMTRLMSGLLYGVRPGDPLSSVAAISIVFGVAILACLIPAWSASRVDPLQGLRTE